MEYWIEDTLEKLGMLAQVCIILVVAVAVFVIVFGLPIYYSTKARCEVYSKSLEVDFGFLTGCFVKDPKSGIWISSDKIENTNGTLKITK
jgi:hypothetical protein